MFVDIPEDHEYRTRDPKLSIMPLLRSRYDMNTGFSPNNPRQQVTARDARLAGQSCFMYLLEYAVSINSILYIVIA